ncbi:hypothetical protein [Dyadobacter psychrophilus]|uniref:Uncharacterized protein n=1 Tax=Dyadobacter psychrophilus TaxID=651661 RepID=A0A1T5H292_9BACT|nr:hypothetical protein [Dyadobacter psychrophilus]SKC14796.1 hypothetical protein SAMN05660293_04737 [Dyadobacter psychrophilus]
MFDLYFQSGDFYNDGGSWIKDLLIPLLGVGVPLWIFYKGIESQRFQDQQKSDEFDLQQLIFSHNLFASAAEFSLAMQANIESVVSNLKSSDWSNDNLPTPSSHDLRRIVFDLDREKLFHAWKRKLASNSVSTIFVAFDTIYDVEKAYSARWLEATREITNRRNKITSGSGKLILGISQIDIENNFDAQVRSRLMEIFVSQNEKLGGEELDAQLVMQHLIGPISDEFEKVDTHEHRKWLPLAKNASDLIALSLQIESIRNSLLTYSLETLSGTLNPAINDLLKHYDPFNEYLKHKNLPVETD